jgi:hypothetical protein
MGEPFLAGQCPSEEVLLVTRGQVVGQAGEAFEVELAQQRSRPTG